MSTQYSPIVNGPTQSAIFTQDKTHASMEKRVWSREEGEMLLDLYDQNKERFKDPGVRKNAIWAEICAAINARFNADFTGERCHQKLRNFKNDFQKVIMLEKKDCRHFDRLHRIFLQSSQKPLRSPTDLKRKLNQLAGPKSSQTESSVPEKKPRTVLPDFRSRKSKAGGPPQGSQRPGVTTQGQQSSNVNRSIMNWQKPSPNASKKTTQVRKNTRPVQLQPLQHRSPAVPLAQGSQNVLNNTPLFLNVQTSSENRNTGGFYGYMGTPAHQTLAEYPNNPNKPRETYVIDETSHNNGPPTDMEKSNSERCTSYATMSMLQNRLPVQPGMCKIELETADGSNTSKTECVTDSLSQVVPETNKIDIFTSSILSASQSWPQATKPSDIIPGRREQEPRSEHANVPARTTVEFVPQNSSNVAQGNYSSAALSATLPVPVNYYSTTKARQAAPQCPTLEAVGLIHPVLQEGKSTGTDAPNRSESQDTSPKTQEPDRSTSLPVQGSTGNTGLTFIRNLIDNKKQSIKKAKPHNEAPAAENRQLGKLDSGISSAINSNEGHGKHMCIDLTETSSREGGQEHLAKIVVSVDKWRQECKAREEAQIIRERAREKRMDEMHQETMRMTERFVQLFETFVTKVAATGDQD